jgi:Flp pilus assembly protein TadD
MLQAAKLDGSIARGQTMRPSRVPLSLLVTAFIVVACATAEEQAHMEGHPKPTNVRPVATEGLRASLHDAARIAERTNDYTSAVTFYNSLYDRNPDDLVAAIGLSRNLRYVGAHDQAADVLERAIHSHPDDATLSGELGKVYLASGEPEQAVASLIKAREMGPGDWRVHSALGIAFDRLGRYESARMSYRSALDLSPNNASVLNNLALSLVQVGELERGIEILKDATGSARTNVQVRQNLALLHALNGDIDEAEKLARQDLPEEMVQANLAYYRRVAQASAVDGPSAAFRPVSAEDQPQKVPGPVQIEPWDEDTEAERTQAIKTVSD